MIKLYEVYSKGLRMLIPAKNRFEAYVRFCKENKDRIKEMAQLITCVDDGDEYPIATAPLLYILGIIDRETAIINVRYVTGCSYEEAEKLLDKSVKRIMRNLKKYGVIS